MKKWMAFGLAMLMVCALALAGCGGSASSAAPASAAAPAEGASTTGKPLKVALILSGPANDQGWNAIALEGLVAAETEFGVETAYMENVDFADSEAAFRDYASQGYDLVIGHGFQFGEPALKVSGDFPDTWFMSTEADSQGDNMASYVMGCEQGAYLLGMLSAGMSESGTIGVVGGFEQPSITKEHEAFKLGAKEINPDIKVLEVYINSYTDAGLGKEAGESMIRQGADVLYQVANQAGTGTITAAQENGVLACCNSYDQASIAPDTVMASTVYSMPNVIKTAVKAVIDGEYVGGVYNLGMAEDVVSITGYGNFEDKIPQDLKDAIAEKQAAILDGSFEVPIIATATK